MYSVPVPNFARHCRNSLALTLGAYTHIESGDDGKFAEQLGGILRPNASKWKEEGVAPGEQPLVQ